MSEKKKKNGRGRVAGKPLTKNELKQRRDAAKKSTGPKTPEGKAISAMNAWKTGEFSKRMKTKLRGKPCFSSCAKYSKCHFILQGQTKPGGKCLDVADWNIVSEATEAIVTAIDSGDLGKVNALAAANMGMLMGIAHQMFTDIQERGINVEKEMYDKEGNVIGSQTLDNPHINNLIKILDKLGINLNDFLATPMAKSKEQVDDAVVETAAMMSSRLMARMNSVMPKGDGNDGVIDVEIVK